MGGDLLLSTRHEETTNSIVYRDLDASRQLTALSDRVSDGTHRESSVEATVDYKHTFAAKGHSLASELRLVRDAEGGPNR